MGPLEKDAAEDISHQFQDLLSRLQSKQFFQSTWDIAAFAIFFTFIGTVLLLAFLALARCCCSCDDEPGSYRKIKKRKAGIDNMGMEP